MTKEQYAKVYDAMERAAVMTYSQNPAYKWHTCHLESISMCRDGLFQATYHLKVLNKSFEAHLHYFEIEYLNGDLIIKHSPKETKVLKIK